MGTSSIQVSERTRRALARYKSDGMTYDDVLQRIMEILPPDEFRGLYRKWQARVAGEIRKSKKWEELDF